MRLTLIGRKTTPAHLIGPWVEQSGCTAIGWDVYAWRICWVSKFVLFISPTTWLVTVDMCDVTSCLFKVDTVLFHSLNWEKWREGRGGWNNKNIKRRTNKHITIVVNPPIWPSFPARFCRKKYLPLSPAFPYFPQISEMNRFYGF